MSFSRANPLVLAQALMALALGACWSDYPQRLPGPLLAPPPAQGEQVPAPTPAPSNAPEITVQRDSDPVWVRRPGERGDYPLPFYRKRERVSVGALVRTGAGGRAELLWSPDASTLALFEEGRVTLGDPERDEPLVRFHSLTRALLVLTPEDRAELVGGSLLAGDPLETTGPILLESAPGSILRVTNQSKLLATIAFRTERLELGPGESIDLPTHVAGAEPYPEAPEPQRFETPGVSVACYGLVERRDEGVGVALTALESARVAALGVETRLEARETARFSGLSQTAPLDPVEPNAQP